AGQAEPKARDVAPAEVAPWDLRLVDRAELVAGVAGVAGHERALWIEHLHQIADDPIRVDRLLVGFHQRKEPLHEGFPTSRDLVLKSLFLTDSAAPGLGEQLLNQRLQAELTVADDRVARLVVSIEVERVD